MSLYYIYCMSIFVFFLFFFAWLFFPRLILFGFPCLNFSWFFLFLFLCFFFSKFPCLNFSLFCVSFSVWFSLFCAFFFLKFSVLFVFLFCFNFPVYFLFSFPVWIFVLFFARFPFLCLHFLVWIFMFCSCFLIFCWTICLFFSVLRLFSGFLFDFLFCTCFPFLCFNFCFNFRLFFSVVCLFCLNFSVWIPYFVFVLSFSVWISVLIFVYFYLLCVFSAGKSLLKFRISCWFSFSPSELLTNSCVGCRRWICATLTFKQFTHFLVEKYILWSIMAH